ncbi:MAG TPA: hypothetical protein VHI51_07500 [Ktedonobacterales bacterium]|jgi:hypothetical protein|nr:hypothetical protein [Ktedonobacterales bacterium]
MPDADETNSGGARLRGWKLALGRIGWALFTLVAIGLNVIALPDSYGGYVNLSQPILYDLARIGLSPTLYTILAMVENAAVPVAYLALSLLLMWRRSDDRMALLCAFSFVAFAGGSSLFDFGSGTVVPSLAHSPFLRLLALTFFAAGEAALVIFFYLFPSGRFAPRWTRFAAVLVVIFYLAVAVSPTLVSNKATGPTPFLIPLFLLSAAVAQVFRYRRSTPRERQQTKWAVFGLAIGAVFLAVTLPIFVFVVPERVQEDPVASNLNPIFQIALLLIPIFITMAILRSHLWDIDTIINKTLVYGLLTALLAIVYVGLISGLQALSGLLFGYSAGNPLALVLSTLAIASLFQPARRAIQNVIDRRFYRRKYNAEATLASFTATLRNQVDQEQLYDRLQTVVSETMHPTHVSLWLRPTSGSRRDG